MLHTLLSCKDTLKSVARGNPSGDEWRALQTIMQHVLDGSTSVRVPRVLLPLHTLSTGAILKLVRGVLGRQERITLQCVSAVSDHANGVYTITVSDGEFSQSGQYWHDDREAVLGTGEFGTLTCTARWLPSEGVILLRNVEESGSGDGVIGEPEYFQLAPPPPTLAAPTQPGVSGVPVGVTINGTTDQCWQPVQSVTCRGGCKHCPVTTSDGYVESADVALASQKCVALEHPPPDFDDVKGAPRGTKRALEADVTNRVRRYALYYFYATCIYKVFGAGTRVQLPKCVVAAVRAKYPNPVGEAYCSDDGTF
jgi:hypothetical protein